MYQHEYDGDERQFSAVEHGHLHFVDNLNRVIESKTLRVNYTSYDIRRGQDFMRPGNGCTVVVLSREDGPGAHPFWYAQIIRAFIIPVINTAPDARNRCQQTMEVLWVRWLGVEPGYRWGFKAARLPKIGFVPETNDNPFGFLDPSLVIRGCHLIPAFSEGRTDSLLKRGESLARQPGEMDDWCAFYVNMYVFFLCFTAPFLIQVVLWTVICFVVLQGLALAMEHSMEPNRWMGLPVMATRPRMPRSRWPIAKMKMKIYLTLAKSRYSRFLPMTVILPQIMATMKTGKVILDLTATVNGMLRKGVMSQVLSSNLGQK